MTRNLILDFYQNSLGNATSLEKATSLATIPETIEWNNSNSTGLLVIPPPPKAGLYQTIKGYQYKATRSSLVGGHHSNPIIQNATFELDPTVFSHLGLAQMIQTGRLPIPYNSTLTLHDDTTLHLEAPFLAMSGRDRSECYTNDSSQGACTCFRGKPLPVNWTYDQNLVCISDSGYVWGFSGPMTVLGLVLELVVGFGCFLLWLDYTYHCELVMMGRPGCGTIRNLLDVAGAIQRDLNIQLEDDGDSSNAGDEMVLGEAPSKILSRRTCASNVELESALKKCPPVGYLVRDVEDDEKGHESKQASKDPLCVELVSVPEGPRQRRKVDLYLLNEKLPCGHLHTDQHQERNLEKISMTASYPVLWRW